jgi:hypothetical protein
MRLVKVSASIGAVLLTACSAGPGLAPHQGTVAPSQGTVAGKAQSAKQGHRRPAGQAGKPLVRPSGRACARSVSVGEAPRRIGRCPAPGPSATVTPPHNSG